jgi:uncharacterized lipoprotein NlpE involved in copper resistance
MKALVTLLAVVLWLSGCASDNEHFCMRYEYLYEQLSDPDVPPYDEIRLQLLMDLNDPKKDHNHAKMMLFVLEEYQLGIKPEDEPAQAYCVRRQRWQAYR